MRIRWSGKPGVPFTPRQQQIESIMARLECYDDLANTEKSTLAEYVESLEDQLQACIKALMLASQDERLQQSGQEDYVLCEVRKALEDAEPVC